jgi:HTH-type transcriptional regulator, sugar sensing transcriptional regulator
MAQPGTLSNLIELGLSEYEGKAYLALLTESPATAYETAKRAGIPSSKIYEVLERMSLRGLVMRRDEGERRLYFPESSAEFLDRQRARLGETLDRLQADLSQLGDRAEASLLWNVSDRSALIDKALSVISRCATELLVSGESEELEALSRAIFQAEERGAKIAIVHFGDQRGPLPGIVHEHPIKDTLQAEKGGRGFALVSDSKEALIGTIMADGRAEGAYSRNKGFIILAEDYVKHDIYVMKIVHRYDAELIRRFGPGYKKLREVFSDEEN